MNTKTCSECKVEKPLGEFHKNKLTPDGLARKCKACRAVETAARYADQGDALRTKKRDAYHRDLTKSRADLAARRAERTALDKLKAAEYGKEYYETNKAHIAAAQAEYQRKNMPAAVRRAREWKIRNPVAVAEDTARRYARKTNATPVWANVAVLRSIYSDAREFRAAGLDVQVDHIVPIRSKVVCGLHVPANLRVILTKANQRKGNRVWPDMP